MASVAQAVDSISLYARMEKPRVRKISRHLIDTAVLPKSVGSLPAQINETHLAALLIAVCTCAVRATADAQRCVVTWGSMTPNGAPNDKGSSLLEMLALAISKIWKEGESGPFTKAIAYCQIEINATRPHARLYLGSERFEYLEVGAEREYLGIETIVHIPGDSLRRIALSLLTGLHYGPVIPLAPRAAEAVHPTQTEPQA